MSYTRAKQTEGAVNNFAVVYTGETVNQISRILHISIDDDL